LWGLLFISIPEKDIPGDAETDEAGKGNSKKDILINVEELHVGSYLKLCHSLGSCYLIVVWSKAGAHIPKMFQ
jgi:hypothetical protein